MSTDRYALNRNEGIDTVHRNAREECNLDDADDREWIDQATADGLLAKGTAKPCRHCMEGDPA